MTELGRTNDPTVLVPGSPDALNDSVQLLNSYGDMLAEAGAGLARIDTSDGWSGTAADGFHQAFQGQPAKWTTAGDCFHAAATAVDAYVSTLTWAQGQAADAIQEWNAGQAATTQAKAAHDQAVQQAQQQAAAAGTTAPNIPFTDPGEAQRQAAQQQLARARAQLANAGNTAADAVDKARDQAPPKPGFWSQLGSDIGNLASEVGHDLENAGAEFINDLASFGNAAIHHPGEMVSAIGGMGLTALSAAGEGGGALLDATGIGALVGVPVNVVSAAGVTTGVGIAGAAMMAMASQAGGEDHVEPLKTDSGSSTGTSSEEPPFEAPKEITGFRNHTVDQIQGREGHGVNDEAVYDAVTNPTKPPRYIPDKYGGTYRYVGQNATVNLNQDGEVTTAWPRNRNGWRHP